MHLRNYIILLILAIFISLVNALTYVVFFTPISMLTLFELLTSLATRTLAASPLSFALVSMLIKLDLVNLVKVLEEFKEKIPLKYILKYILLLLATGLAYVLAFRELMRILG